MDDSKGAVENAGASTAHPRCVKKADTTKKKDGGSSRRPATVLPNNQEGGGGRRAERVLHDKQGRGRWATRLRRGV